MVPAGIWGCVRLWGELLLLLWSFMTARRLANLSFVSNRPLSASKAPVIILFSFSSPTMSLPLTRGETRLSQTRRGWSQV